MDKENVIYTYKEILFSLKRLGGVGFILQYVTTWIDWIDFRNILLTKYNKPETERQVLNQFTYMRYLKQSNK